MVFPKAAVEAIAEFIEAHLQMFWPDTIISSKNKRLGVRNNCKNPRHRCLSVHDWKYFVFVYIIIKRIIYVQTICLHQTVFLKMRLDKIDNNFWGKTIHGFHLCKSRIFFHFIRGNSSQNFGLFCSPASFVVLLLITQNRLRLLQQRHGVCIDHIVCP